MAEEATMNRADLMHAVDVTDARWPRHPRRVVAVAGTTAVFAVVGGVLLMVAPDGSLLQAAPAALAHSPFSTWRVPGLLLLVG